VSGELLPLTLAQAEVWNTQRLLGVDDLYNIGAWTLIEGSIDVARLRTACQRAVREGASLCYTIAPTPDGPRQQCHPDAVIDIPLLDLSGEADPESAAQARMRERFRRPFDLVNGPVARVELLRTAPQRLVLYFVAHHLFTDLYGGRAMLQRAAALYDGAEDAAPLTPWHEVLAAERNYRDSPQWQRDRAHWLELLRDRPAAATLSGRAGVAHPDATRSAVMQVPHATLDALARIAGSDAGATASAVLAVVAMYLARAGGSDDIVLGMAMSGRAGRRLRRASGFLSNVVPVRLQVDGAKPFRALLAAAASQLRHAMQGQNYPASALRADLGLAAGDEPLFATRLNFMPCDAEASFGGHPAQLHAFTHAPRVEDLSITAHARKDGELRLQLDGRASHYSEAELPLHGANLLRLLEEVAAHPDTPVEQLLQPVDAERHRLLAQWGDGGADAATHTVLQRLAQWAAAAAGDVAVTDGARTLDFAALDARSEQMARQLRALGVGPEVIVGLWADRSPEMIVGLLGIWKAGGAYVGLDPDLPDERLRHMLRDARARVVVARDGAARTEVCDGMAVSIVGEQLAAPPTVKPAASAAADPLDAAYLIHTSGSTGTPKAVVVPHAGIAALAAAQSRHVGMGRASRVLQVASLGFDASVAELVTSLWSGAALVLAPRDALSGLPLQELLRREQITHVTLTPTVLDTLPPGAGPALQSLIVAGEACPRHLVDAWSSRLRMFNAYGPSECTVCATMSAPLAPGAAVTIGRPIAGTRVYVVDANLRLLPAGMTGELCIAGAGVARGYLGRPALTAERFVPDPFGARGERMYRSGDRVRWTAAGELEFLGRNDEQVKLRGQRIEPGEIEAVLAAQPQVESAAVALQDMDSRGRALVAFLVARPGHASSLEGLRAALAARLPRAMIPSRFVWLDALPRTLGGKLDRRALAALRVRAGDAPREPPVGATEQAVAALWQQLLQVTELSRHDDFFALGGNSLLLTQLAEAFAQRGWTLEPGALFASPTIAMLAAAIDARHERPAAVLPEADASQRAAVAARVPGGAANLQDIYPLAPLQAGLLVQHRALEFDPYVSRVLLEFADRARLDGFIAALQIVVARHDALRTAILWEGLPEPVQVVWRHAELPVTWPTAGATADAASLWQREPLSLEVTRAPLLHIVAMPDADQLRWRVLLHLHHLVVDLHSLHIILAEVAACLRGEVAALPPAVPFRRFVADALAAAQSPLQAAFFRRMLAGLAAPTLPFGIADSRTDGSGIEEARLPLDASLAARLRVQAQRHAVLPSTLFHVAWAEVLARAAGHRDIVFGTVLSGRHEVAGEAAGVVGLCINTLPLRVELADKPPAVLVSELQSRLSMLLRHEQAAPAAALGANPLPGTALFTSILNFRPDPLRIASEPAPLMAGVTLLRLAQRTNYRLGLCIDEQPTGFCLTAQAEGQVGAARVCTLVRDALAALVAALEHAQPVARTSDTLPVDAASGPVDTTAAAVVDPPRSATEQRLAGIWCEVLRLPAVGRADDFFALGGHSLLALQVIARLRAGFGVELPLKRLFDTPQLGALAAVLDAMRGAGSAPGHGQIVPRIWRAPAPLSYSQERMWLIQQMNPSNVAYNMPAALWIRGELDAPLLGRCLDQLAERHDVLRTQVETVQGEARARVLQPRRGLLEQIDLRGHADARAEALALVTRGARELFDLARGPVLRAWLVRTSEHESLFALVVHHIASDQWSMGIIGREMAQLYRWGRRGRRDNLPPLAISYRDFATWQRGPEFTARLAGQLAFWRTRLADLPAIDLPTDLPRPRLWTMNGEVVHVQMPLELLPALTRLASARGATPFMVLFAGLAALLNRVTGQHDLPIGVPVAGRTLHEVEGLVGTFVNTLVLRADLSGELSFEQLVARVRELSLAAFDNPDVPFDRLVQELGQRGDRARAPLAQVMFNVTNAPSHGIELEGASWEEQPLARGGSQFELSFTIDTARNDQLLVEFNTDLFTRETAQRLADQYLTLLAAAVAGPARRLDQLDIIPPAQRAALRRFNATQRALPAGLTFPRLFAEQVARTPARTALRFQGEAFDYARLDAAATQLAQRLRAAGADRGSVVAVCMARSPWLLITLLAVQRSGAAYLPLDPGFPAARLAYMLEDSGAQLVVRQGALPAGLRLPEGVASIEAQSAGGAASGGVLDVEPGPGDAAYILYTSGSTGQPKGVVVPHGALANFLVSMRDEPGLAESDVLAAVTTVSFDIAGLELFLPLVCGACIELLSREEATDGATLMQVLQRSGATIMQATPATWRMLIDAGWKGAKQFRVLCGGEALSRRLADELLERSGAVWNMYGPTETTIWSTLDRVEPGQPITIGRPILNTQVHVVNEQGMQCPIGVAGEIWIGGAGVALGYHARPALTAERFVADGFAPDSGGRLYRTGDLGRRLPDGRLQHLGRIDHQVKVRGFRIELGEVEQALATHPQVLASVATVREARADDPRLIAYVLFRDGQRCTGTDIKRFLRERLPDYAIPSIVMPVERIPQTPNGKLDRAALPDPFTSLTGEFPVLEALESGTEEQLGAIWGEILGVGWVGPHDNFFELGGHSLLSLRVALLVEQRSGRKLDPRLLFFNTLREIARTVDGDDPVREWRSP
jgi:amino acid adenylation domain-containing protein